ncbi:MAG: MAPEG family protein [Gammaproteobacteria bacterium]|nr:MAPEG family protein [Gammaproteobacteria bacterium]
MQVVKTTRHFANLFEMPVLFYLACVLCLVVGLTSGALVVLSWLYVIFRILHATIHLTYNNVRHRLAAFVASNICLIGIWGIIVGHTI